MTDFFVNIPLTESSMKQLLGEVYRRCFLKRLLDALVVLLFLIF